MPTYNAPVDDMMFLFDKLRNNKKYNEILYWNNHSFIWNICNDRLGIKD